MVVVLGMFFGLQQVCTILGYHFDTISKNWDNDIDSHK